jgi:hypothetical protein
MAYFFHFYSLFAIPFCIGVFSYVGFKKYESSFNSSIRSTLNKFFDLDFFSMALFLFFLYMMIIVLIPYLYNYLLENNVINIIQAASDNTTSNSNGSSSNVGKAANGAIMATSLAAAAKLAQKAPTPATKAAVLLGGAGLGAVAIAVKNISGNLTEDVGKSIILLSFFIRNDSNNDFYSSELAKFFNLTGNHLIDLLKMIEFLTNLELFLFYFLIYSLILSNIKISLIEKYLFKILPERLAKGIIKSISIFQK